jgi:3'-phosphoadenosine 5'-phosphosulfate sulfotransferase (PAPS reductase)/FAD synthetase
MISTNSTIDELIKNGAAVALALSGGKDSSIAALATSRHLDALGHTGERLLIHSDLGSIEWTDSINICNKLAERLNLPLVVVRRKAGGMMQRWLTRWKNNVARYTNLLCAKLILPWSTPSMRFCTSELKTAIICRELAQRFKGQTIINVTGIRRAESKKREKSELFKPNKLLTKTDGTTGFDWLPIVEMETEDVFLVHRHFDFPLHEAYTTYKCSRVSCRFCIMSNEADLHASAACEANQEIYREICELEILSAFSFQSSKWLSDVAPHLLTAEQLERLALAKQIAKERDRLQLQIPKHLLFVKGKPLPQAIPTFKEAVLLAKIRTEVSRLQNLDSKYLGAFGVINRYTELKEANDLKEVEKKEKAAKKALKTSCAIVEIKTRKEIPDVEGQ